MMREYYRALTIDGNGECIVYHKLEAVPDFVHIMPRSTCSFLPWLWDMDAERIRLVEGQPGFFFDLLIIKDHSLIQ